MNDRYSYRQGMAIPNPDLGAEHGLTTEVGYEVKLARRLTLTVAGYRTGIDNLIQRVVVRPNVIQFQNVGRVTHAGFDVSAAWRPLATLQTDATYGYLHRRNEVDPAVLLLDTPRHHVAVTPTWMPMPAVTLSALLSADSSRPSQTNSGRAVVLPAFARVDLKGSWRFAHGLSAEVSLFNAGNKHIAYMEGYPEAGRSWLVGTRWVF